MSYPVALLRRRPVRSFLVVIASISLTVATSSLAPTAPRAEGIADRPNAVIVGDSITASHEPFIQSAFERQGIPGIIIAAHGARRISESYVYNGEFIPSGVSAVRDLQARGIDPRLWVIELGTNEILPMLGCSCPDQLAFADDLIGEMLNTLGPAAQVAWVTTSFRTAPLATNTFNEALRRRAAVDPRMTLSDWHALTVTHPGWFKDPVHPNDWGGLVLTSLYIDTVSKLLAPPLPPPSPHSHADRLGMF